MKNTVSMKIMEMCFGMRMFRFSRFFGMPLQ